MPFARNSPDSRNERILSEADHRAALAELLATRKIFEPRPRLNVWQHAERYRYVAKGVSAKTLEGPKLYSSADAPHQKKPQESATDSQVQVTVLIMASQIGGKTEIFNNVLSYHMHWEPRSSVVMYPQLDAAEKYSKKKFTPMVEASPELSAILKPARMRDSGNTILQKDFRGGSVYFVGANSPTSLRASSGAVLLGDEIDSMPPSAGIEGDPIELLWKRGESFPNCVKMLASTPTVKGLSRIWEWWELSDQQFWFVPCPKCGEFQALKWDQIKWPAGTDKAFLECRKCAAGLDDRQRLEMYFNGDWRPTAPFKGIRGFHLNGIYVPWPAQKGYQNRLHQMAEEFLRAQKGGEMKVRVWINTFLCELWEEATEEIDHVAIYGRAENYSPEKLPEGVVLILTSVDVQKNRLELETIGLGLDEETWGIEYRVIEGDTEQDDVWNDLADHLSKTYRREDGAVLPITASTIDMRHQPHKVRKFVQKSGIPRVFPVYGVNSANQPILVTTRFNKHYRLRTFAVAGRIAKDIIFARLRLEEQGPRYMHYPKGQGYGTKYFEGLTAEVLKRKKMRGVLVESYEKIRERNEPLDIRVYFLAGIDILKPNLTAIARNIKGSAQKEKRAEEGTKPGDPLPQEGDIAVPGTKPANPAATPAKSGARRRIRIGGFGGGWKL